MLFPAMISLFELFKIGIGPSSSHTVGPMLATKRFVEELAQEAAIESVRRVQVELFGSLALTGLGHGTDRAAVLGLEGEHPRSVDPDNVQPRFAEIARERSLRLLGRYPIEFDPELDLIFHRDRTLPRHPNGIRCTAYGEDGGLLLERRYYSIGGGFIVGDSDAEAPEAESLSEPFPFTSGAELLSICRDHHLSMAEVVDRNERVRYTEEEIAQNLDAIWKAMYESIQRGCAHPGTLPGGLGVRRRAPELYRKLTTHPDADTLQDPLLRMDWVTMFALAVNEENAAGGRVVTAPTNGAAGIIPAVLAYHQRFIPGASHESIHTFLKTAGAIGMLYKRNASLSAAEMGCQGEVGVACSMAAAGLAAVMGGSPEQVENAAETGMEHNLGLTCDPVGGLVQIPCIERNAIASVKAINAARMALRGDGTHHVSLDKVIKTMRETGADMKVKYKETARGGLAVNIVEC